MFSVGVEIAVGIGALVSAGMKVGQNTCHDWQADKRILHSITLTTCFIICSTLFRINQEFLLFNFYRFQTKED
jgi:hypothetical protein